jgi:hypothetical protein
MPKLVIDNEEAVTAAWPSTLSNAVITSSSLLLLSTASQEVLLPIIIISIVLEESLP